MEKAKAQAQGVPARMHEGAEIFKAKNNDYGSSYQKTGGILREMCGGSAKLETVEDFIQFGLLVRMTDKMMRFANLRFSGKDQQVKDESMIDTAGDLGNYSYMLAEEVAAGHDAKEEETKPNGTFEGAGKP
jgi:hypothetical protein